MRRIIDSRIRLCLLLAALLTSCIAEAQDYADHRNELFATQGTDFWVCFPQAFENNPASVHNDLMFVSENDCDVTVANERTGWRQTYRIVGYNSPTRRADTTNLIELPWSLVKYVDTINPDLYHGTYDEDMSNQPGWRPQNKAFHITSTDTIAVFQILHEMDHMDVVNVMPTELLRDEYVVQAFPTDEDEHGQMVDIIATEDNTVVDIVFTDWDWLNRHPGDTFTVTLQRGQLYHFANGRMSDKFHGQNYPQSSTIRTNAFSPRSVVVKTTSMDLSGTRITARDGKRISVYESTQSRYLGVIEVYSNIFLIHPDTNTVTIEQDKPVRYAGKEFFITKPQDSTYSMLRFAGLADGTSIVIMDLGRTRDFTRTLTVDENGTTWFELAKNDGPIWITTSQPVMVKMYSLHDNALLHERGFGILEYYPLHQRTVIPVEWWHSGSALYYPCHWDDSERNRHTRYYDLHILARTEDAPNLNIDYHTAGSILQPVSGVPFSSGIIPTTTAQVDFQSVGVHYMDFAPRGFYTAYETVSALFDVAHKQVGGDWLFINGRAANRHPEDSLWCMLDTVYFSSLHERPADSVTWDFGDGTVLHYAYEDSAWMQQPHRYQDTGYFTVRRIVTYRDEGSEGCISCKSSFTRKPDTLTTTLRVRYHFDTSIVVRQCEGYYTFHQTEYTTSGIYEDTTYWTESGCDTLWHLDLVTCPHCSEVLDTINPAQLPWNFNGISFNSEYSAYPIYIDIGEECDSIIYYYLTVRAGWGEPKPDSVFVLVPNVFTPSRESNNRFKVIGNEYIEQLEVFIFDRQGQLITHFDGLTEDWDGTHNGEPCKSGTYVYRLRYIDVNIRNWQTRNGTVTLIR